MGQCLGSRMERRFEDALDTYAEQGKIMTRAEAKGVLRMYKRLCKTNRRTLTVLDFLDFFPSVNAGTLRTVFFKFVFRLGMPKNPDELTAKEFITLVERFCLPEGDELMYLLFRCMATKFIKGKRFLDSRYLEDVCPDFANAKGDKNVNFKFKMELEAHARMSIKEPGQTDNLFSLEDFMAVKNRSKFVAFPVFFMQEHVRKRILGVAYWTKKRTEAKERRAREAKSMTTQEKQEAEKARAVRREEQELYRRLGMEERGLESDMRMEVAKRKELEDAPDRHAEALVREQRKKEGLPEEAPPDDENSDAESEEMGAPKKRSFGARLGQDRRASAVVSFHRRSSTGSAAQSHGAHRSNSVCTHCGGGSQPLTAPVSAQASGSTGSAKAGGGLRNRRASAMARANAAAASPQETGSVDGRHRSASVVVVPAKRGRRRSTEFLVPNVQSAQRDKRPSTLPPELWATEAEPDPRMVMRDKDHELVKGVIGENTPVMFTATTTYFTAGVRTVKAPRRISCIADGAIRDVEPLSLV